MRWSLSIVVCAMWCSAFCAKAEPTVDAGASAHSETPSIPPDQKLGEAKLLLERAQFDKASALLFELLDEPALRANTRNDALELLAIAQIAARKDERAKKTLLTLLRRDPDHPRQIHDPGPSVDAAFARARQALTDIVSVPIRFVLDRDHEYRLRLSVDLGEGRDAVQSVHVILPGPHDARETHLVREVEGTAPLSFVLPPPQKDAHMLAVAIEAQAPSGFVLGRLASPEAPHKLTVPPLPEGARRCAEAKKPLRRQWWVWTTVGLVVSGFAVASAVATK